MSEVYQSVQGRSIDVYSFGTGPKTIMYMAGVHGDERDGVDIVQAIREMLPKIDLDSHRIVLMPCANPDGYAANTRQNANGVDLNRNFPDKTYVNGEDSGSHCRGQAAASEPETKAIMAVVNEYRPKLIISLHADMACVNYNGACVRLANKMSKALGLPAMGDIGYPCPGSMGNYYGFDKRLPVITLELPGESVDIAGYAHTLLSVVGLTK